MNIKIVVATHKKACMPCDDMYLPVLAGSVLHEEFYRIVIHEMKFPIVSFCAFSIINEKSNSLRYKFEYNRKK